MGRPYVAMRLYSRWTPLSPPPTSFNLWPALRPPNLLSQPLPAVTPPAGGVNEVFLLYTSGGYSEEPYQCSFPVGLNKRQIGFPKYNSSSPPPEALPEVPGRWRGGGIQGTYPPYYYGWTYEEDNGMVKFPYNTSRRCKSLRSARESKAESGATCVHAPLHYNFE